MSPSTDVPGHWEAPDRAEKLSFHCKLIYEMEKSGKGRIAGFPAFLDPRGEDLVGGTHSLTRQKTLQGGSADYGRTGVQSSREKNWMRAIWTTFLGL